MTLADFKIIAKRLKGVYANDNFIPDEESLKTWYALLGDIPYEVMNVAIQKYMLTNHFPPTPADLRGIAVNLVQGDSDDWSKAWEKVRSLIRKHGHNGQEEAFAEMDDKTRMAVKRMGWRDICESENIAVERANFRQIYEQVKEEEKTDAVLPSKIKDFVKQLTGNELKRIGEVK